LQVASLAEYGECGPPFLTAVRASFLDYHDTICADAMHMTLHPNLVIGTGTENREQAFTESADISSSTFTKLLLMAYYRSHWKRTISLIRDIAWFSIDPLSTEDQMNMSGQLSNGQQSKD
jgi:hypothetical protein